jgi:chorismate mutase
MENMLRGIRGAIDVKANTANDILVAADQLMRALIDANGVKQEFVSAVFFTVTPDLNGSFPAAVRTKIGWNLVPFLCSQEIPVEGALQRILRVLVLWETDRTQEEIRHQYLGGAAALRPDLKT